MQLQTIVNNFIEMDELAEYSLPVIEFIPKNMEEKLQKLVNNSTATDPLPASKDIVTNYNKL